MSKATHMLAMAGMALVAGAAFGASPAAAAPAAPQAATTSASSSVARTHVRSGDRFGGFYRTERACERAGEFLSGWNDYDCDRVWRGPRRGWWILTLEGRRGGHHGHGGWGHGGWGHDHGGWGHDRGGWGDHRGGWGDHRGMR